MAVEVRVSAKSVALDGYVLVTIRFGDSDIVSTAPVIASDAEKIEVGQVVKWREGGYNELEIPWIVRSIPGPFPCIPGTQFCSSRLREWMRDKFRV